LGGDEICAQIRVLPSTAKNRTGVLRIQRVVLLNPRRHATADHKVNRRRHLHRYWRENQSHCDWCD